MKSLICIAYIKVLFWLTAPASESQHLLTMNEGSGEPEQAIAISFEYWIMLCK